MLAVVSPSRMLSDIAQVLAVPSFVIVVTQASHPTWGCKQGDLC